MQDTAVPIDAPDRFTVPVLIHRKKTSKCNKTSSTNFPPGSPFYGMNSLFTVNLQGEDQLLETLNNVFTVQQNRVLPKRILISGEPGIGKSTLLLKYAFDWAIKDPESALRDVQLLIHLSLAGVPLDATLGEEIIKQNLPCDTKLTGTVIEECIRRHENEVVILLDSYDESVFASNHVLNSKVVHGSLHGAILYKYFTRCRIVITARPWKDEQFHCELFNPYAEIVLTGMSGASANKFISGYCSVKNENLVRRTLQTNLVNLRPVFRNPLFMAMVCEMIANDVNIDIPFTITTLFQELCSCLYNKYQNKSTPMDQKYIITLCHTLGKIVVTNNCHYIEYGSVQLTQEHRDIIDLGLAIGLLSTRRGGSSRKESKKLVFFFHDLLRNFCATCYFFDPSCDVLGESQLYSSHPLVSPYTCVFGCGFCPPLIRIIDKFPKCEQDDYIRVHDIGYFIQCLFETKKKHLPIENFNCAKERCVVLNLNVVNSHAAAEYFISRLCQLGKAYQVNEFVVIGDHLMCNTSPLRKEKNCCLFTDDDMNIFCLNNDIDIFSDLLFRCKFITKLVLMNMCIAYNLPEIDFLSKNIKKLCNIEILKIKVSDIQIVKFIFDLVIQHFDDLRSLYLFNVRSSSNLNDKEMTFQEIFFLLCNVANTANTITLSDVADVGLNEFFVTPEILPQVTGICVKELVLISCVGRINFQQFLSNLALCPCLTKITLFICDIDFKVLNTTKVNASSVQNLELTIHKCGYTIELPMLMYIITEQYPNLTKSILNLEESDVEWGKFRPLVIKNEWEIKLFSCHFSVSPSQIQCFQGKINKFIFSNCTLNPESNILSFAIFCSHDSPCFIIEDNTCIYVELKYDKNKDIKGDEKYICNLYMKILGETGSKGHLNVRHFMTFLNMWFPSTEYMDLYSKAIFDISSLKMEESQDISVHHGVKQVVFTSCKEYLDIRQHLEVLCEYFPNMSVISCRDCNITFSYGEPKPITREADQNSLRRVIIDECKSLNFPDVITLGILVRPIKEIIIRECDVNFNFTNNEELDIDHNNLDAIKIEDCKVPFNLNSLLSIGYPGLNVINLPSTKPQTRSLLLSFSKMSRPISTCTVL